MFIPSPWAGNSSALGSGGNSGTSGNACEISPLHVGTFIDLTDVLWKMAQFDDLNDDIA